MELAEPAELTFFIVFSTIQAIYLRDFVESQFHFTVVENPQKRKFIKLFFLTN